MEYWGFGSPLTTLIPEQAILVLQEYRGFRAHPSYRYVRAAFFSDLCTLFGGDLNTWATIGVDLTVVYIL